MHFSVFFISIILLSPIPGQCQRRNTWGPRQGNRRPTVKEERMRGVRAPQVVPNYNPVPNRPVPVAAPCQRPAEPPCAKVFEPTPQVLQNLPIPMPTVPNVELAQNVVISPNLQLMQPPQIFPNPPPIQKPVSNVPIIQGQNFPNSQYMPAPNVPLIPEIPVQNVPLLDVPVKPAEKIRMHIPYPSVEPLERFSCISPPSLVSPYLPASSPVSGYSPPSSNYLPPLTTSQSRSHFLRKIPIPPPTL